MKAARIIWLIGALLSVAALSASATPQWSLPDDVKSVEVNSYDMAYREMGSGPPLLLIHGALNDYRYWNDQFPAFSPTYRTIAVSLRHYYPEKWDGNGGGFSIDQHVADVASFIQVLHLGKVNLLGHSRGGAVALNVAKEHPDLIKTLILEDAGGLETLLPDTPESQKLATEARETANTLKANLAKGDVDSAARGFIDSLGGPGTWAKRTPAQRQIILDNMTTAAVDAGDRPPISCDQIRKFDFPILLINGERSPKRFGEMFAAMRHCKDISVPVVIPDAAHAMNRENPAAFNTAVLGFLAKN